MKIEEKQQEHLSFGQLIRQNWLPAYSWVLIVNGIYILIFLLIMIIFS